MQERVQRGGSTNRCGIQIYLLQPAVVVELELSCNAVGASWSGKLSQCVTLKWQIRRHMWQTNMEIERIRQGINTS